MKNAIYKVIRAASADDLGQHIVVQGGTFLNDAVLRSFELELGRDVTRPTIAGIMGAYGAALYARELNLEKSAILTPEQLAGVPNLARYKYQRLRALTGTPGPRGRIGIPFGLNMYENLPFWHAFFTKLGFEVVLSEESSRKLYIKGQQTIPSDTVCYPAKLMHGHIMSLLEQGVDTIFYPCMPYNFDEGLGDNNYNCPVVAYYPELLAANMPQLKKTRFLNPYFGLHRPRDFEKRAAAYFEKEFSIPKKETVAAAKAAYAAYDASKEAIRKTGREYIDYARANGKKIIVMAGRPYHIDPEIGHGIDELITSFDFVLITEDSVAYLMDKESRTVLNQWTYHSRMYNAARYVCTQEDMQLVQLVSFGCGVDAITTDELRSILETGGKLYTQLKIDDISNLGAVRIRLRSLIAAIEAREADNA